VGLFDSLLGRTKPVRPNLDALFALPSAAVTLQTSEGLVLSGHAGICWKPPAGQSATDVQQEITDLLAMPDDPTSTAPATGTVTNAEDKYGYRWLLLDDPDTETLVTRVHLVNTSLTENGWGPQLLCSVFGLVPEAGAGADARPLFLVYLYKRGSFYPFAPDGPEHRDSELELRIRAVVANDLPVEQDLQRWFPLWDLPVT
jgi:PspAB-like protein